MSVLIAGVDEAGRGCLAGPVIAAVTVFPENFDWPFEVKDSKQLTPKRREALALLIKEHAIDWSVGRAEVHEIESINILQATLLAMKRAMNGLSVCPHRVDVDGNRAPVWDYYTRTVVQGDQTVPSIMAASILAKVARDQEMVELSLKYPLYHFDKHKGYGTDAHLEALKRWGVTPLHRRTFEPIRAMLLETESCE